MAVDGMFVKIRGCIPREKPESPSRRYIILNASPKPRTLRSSASVAVPRVCNNVFATSSGVVTAAATAPARPPAVICVTGL